MSVIFDGLTLVDSSAKETYHVALWSPARANVMSVNYPFAKGRMVKVLARSDTPEHSRRWVLSDGEGRSCVLRKTSLSTYETFLASVYGKLDTIGTLQIEGESFTNVHFSAFEVMTVLKTDANLYLVRFNAAFEQVEA